MGRTWLAVACAVAGVAVLAGPGWALLTAAALIYVAPIPETVARRAAQARDVALAAAAAAWQWLARPHLHNPEARRPVATLAMPSAVLLTAAGAGIAFGVGIGLVVSGLAVGGLSLMLGWNT